MYVHDGTRTHIPAAPSSASTSSRASSPRRRCASAATAWRSSAPPARRSAPGVVRDGEVADAEALAEALRELFREHKLGKRVRLGVANQRIVVRTIDLPPLDDAKEIAAAVRFHAQDHIPMPLDQAVLEHQSLGARRHRRRASARASCSSPRAATWSSACTRPRAQAGLRPAGIDLSAFAMIRALHRRRAPARRSTSASAA